MEELGWVMRTAEMAEKALLTRLGDSVSAQQSEATSQHQLRDEVFIHVRERSPPERGIPHLLLASCNDEALMRRCADAYTNKSVYCVCFIGNASMSMRRLLIELRNILIRGCIVYGYGYE